MRDLISRREAIDAIVKWAESHHENPDGDDCIMIILDVPSAQPEIIHCRDCRYSTDFYQDGCCYCKIPSKEMRYIEEGWDFYCAAGKENR